MNYWEKRLLDQHKILYDKSLQSFQQELAKEYMQSYKNLKNQMLDVYDRILLDDKVTINALYRYNRYYDLLNNIQDELTKLGNKEIPVFEDRLTKMYFANEALIGKQLDFKISINPEQAQKAINALWCSDGKHFSDRIWNNKKDLANKLEQGLIDCASMGVKREDLTKNIMASFNQSFNNADKVARTELTYVQNISTKDKYQQAGVEKYKFLATDDDRTGDVDAELDGQVFRLDEAIIGVNFPPIHPNCRCTILAVVD